MAIVKPAKFIPLTTFETAYLSTVSEETTRKIAQNLNKAADLVPIGSIRGFNPAQPGYQAIDTSIWQVCDGAEIVNPNSPIRTIGVTHSFTPNMLDRFPVGSPDLVSNALIGTPSIDLTHNHAGNTEVTDGDHIGAKGHFAQIRDPHTHTINNDLGVTALQPAHHELVFYMKVV